LSSLATDSRVIEKKISDLTCPFSFHAGVFDMWTSRVCVLVFMTLAHALRTPDDVVPEKESLVNDMETNTALVQPAAGTNGEATVPLGDTEITYLMPLIRVCQETSTDVTCHTLDVPGCMANPTDAACNTCEKELRPCVEKSMKAMCDLHAHLPGQGSGQRSGQELGQGFALWQTNTALVQPAAGTSGELMAVPLENSEIVYLMPLIKKCKEGLPNDDACKTIDVEPCMANPTDQCSTCEKELKPCVEQAMTAICEVRGEITTFTASGSTLF